MTEPRRGRAERLEPELKPASRPNACLAETRWRKSHGTRIADTPAPAEARTGQSRNSRRRNQPRRAADTVSTSSPVLDLETHRATVAAALAEAKRLGKVEPEGPPDLTEAPIRVFSLERWQSPFKTQNDRGTCWAFAGAAALEAAYRRKFNMVIDVSEEYVFHMGKSFALNRTPTNAVVTPVENNSSLTGFQGSGDIVKKLTENAVAPNRRLLICRPSKACSTFYRR